MSLLSRLSAHLLNPLFGTAYLSGTAFQELPAGLELVSPHGERLRTTEAVKFSAKGVSQPVPIERAEFDNYRPIPVPFVSLEKAEWEQQHRIAAALGTQPPDCPGCLLGLLPMSNEITRLYMEGHENEVKNRFRESFLGPAPYKRYMALSNVVDEGFYSDDAMSERIAAALDFADESSCRRNKARHRNVIPTGSPPVAEKLPVWEANARGVLAGAKRWAQLRWGGL